jgi:hypothetical protein
VEQARQTVLADAKEMLLFCYGSLQENTGPANVVRLRTEIPGLFELAKLVRGRAIKGVAAPKVPNSDAGKESYVYDFVGMLGLPLVPTASIRTDVKAAFLPVHTLKDPGWAGKVRAMVEKGTPVLVTDGLAGQLPGDVRGNKHLSVLNVGGEPKRLLKLTREELKPIRERLLAPFGLRFDAPNKVALYLMGDDCVVVENFNDEAVTATLEFARPTDVRVALTLPVDADASFSCAEGKVQFRTIGPRTLVVLRYR